MRGNRGGRQLKDQGERGPFQERTAVEKVEMDPKKR